MDTAATNDDESWRSTKRWYRKYPELSPPGEMPVEPFISEAQYERELKLLWPKVWLLAGRVEEIKGPGDYLIKEIPPLGISLIVVRGRDGKIRAFHNACTHRGSKICWQKGGATGTAGSFMCPYHGFTFNLSGQLVSVPDEANFYGLDRTKLGLREVVTDVWNGFVFFHLDPEPRESLKDYLGEIVAPLANYPFEGRLHYYEYTAEISANWKILVASFLEGYHGHIFHKGNLDRSPWKDNPFSHTFLIKLFDKHRLISLGRSPHMTPTRVEKVAVSRIKATGHDQLWRAGGAGPADGAGPQDVSKLFTEIYSTFVIHNIFPNLQLNIVGGLWYFYQFWPVAVDRVIWQGRLYYPEPTCASDRFFVEFHKVKDRDILMEDGHVCELQYPVMKAGVIDRWMLQDEEIAIQHFNKVVADYTAPRPARTAAEQAR